MILKGSQRGGGQQLATHLMNTIDNDHVTVHELRGFVSEDLGGALAEAHAISKGTQCEQFMFSLSLNPPKDAACGIEQLVEAADRAEVALGLQGQPRAIVVHEKEGRRHIHAVWSRIDASTMKAVPLPFFKNKLASLSKELYLEHGWDLPEGHRENGWRNALNFTLAEWQQCKRLGLDPREVKQLFGNAWRYSDGPQAFRAALEDRGYFLAKGDRRGFVAVDLSGEVFSVARMAGVKAKELEARLGSPDGLDSVDRINQRIKERMTDRLRHHSKEIVRAQRDQMRPLTDERRAMVLEQRRERERVKELQEKRWQAERVNRQSRFRRGVRGLWDVLTGRAGQLRRTNEAEAIHSYLRDAAQREALFEAQHRDRLALQSRIAELRADQRHTTARLRQHVAGLVGDDHLLDQHRNQAMQLRLQCRRLNSSLNVRS